MSFSMKLPAAKGKKKPLGAPFSSDGKQYGLVIPKKDAKEKVRVQVARRNSLSTAHNLTPKLSSPFQELATGFNVFASAAAANSSKQSAAAEQETDARRRVGAEAARSLQQTQVDKVRAQALADDPSVFDYDAVYDDMKSARESEASQRAAKREAEKKKPKYISTLLQQAKIREVENERIRERRLVNERKADDALYGDKEKLVSASYKRKLQEMQRWDAEDARLAALEENEDVTKQGEHAMAGFTPISTRTSQWAAPRTTRAVRTRPRRRHGMRKLVTNRLELSADASVILTVSARLRRRRTNLRLRRRRAADNRAKVDPRVVMSGRTLRLTLRRHKSKRSARRRNRARRTPSPLPELASWHARRSVKLPVPQLRYNNEIRALLTW